MPETVTATTCSRHQYKRDPQTPTSSIVLAEFATNEVMMLLTVFYLQVHLQRLTGKGLSSEGCLSTSSPDERHRCCALSQQGTAAAVAACCGHIPVDPSCIVHKYCRTGLWAEYNTRYPHATKSYAVLIRITNNHNLHGKCAATASTVRAPGATAMWLLTVPLPAWLIIR